MSEEARRTNWEYLALSVGSFWGTRESDLQARLNELGLEGWEVVNVYTTYGSGKTTVVAKRPLKAGALRRRHREAYGLES